MAFPVSVGWYPFTVSAVAGNRHDCESTNGQETGRCVFEIRQFDFVAESLPLEAERRCPPLPVLLADSDLQLVIADLAIDDCVTCCCIALVPVTAASFAVSVMHILNDLKLDKLLWFVSVKS